eukprot:jgi/Psemu1/21050/gm1.21050_g
MCQTNPESKQGGYKEKLLKDTSSIRRKGSSYQQSDSREVLTTTTFARPPAAVTHAAPKQAHCCTKHATNNEHTGNYFHYGSNRYKAPLPQEYNNEDRFYHDDEAKCYHQDAPDQHHANY